jgi:uncharacterized Fe-S cluster-containing radical SAM superfamily protein
MSAHSHHPLPLLPARSPAPDPSASVPRIRLRQLDSLWFQVTGTLCNLACTHCFISCSPTNHSFGFLDHDTVLRALDQSRALGVKEYYFTGGEPFMHPRLLEMLSATLAIGPATVLTNGTLVPERTARALAYCRDRSNYSLEIRVSIDAPDAEANDRIRGPGAFDRAMSGVRNLLAAGFLPIITVAQTWEDDEQTSGVYQKMRQAMLEIGYTRPRIKLMPALRIGAEALRSRGYRDDERISSDMMIGFDTSTLLCSATRVISSRGVHVCPILIEQPDARLSESLPDSIDIDYPLARQACYTCWRYGAICSNAPAETSAPAPRRNS